MSRSKLNPHFFKRERDGSVRLRIRFTPEEASLIEEAAGDTPLVAYIHHLLSEGSRRRVEESRKQRAKTLHAPIITGDGHE